MMWMNCDDAVAAYNTDRINVGNSDDVFEVCRQSDKNENANGTLQSAGVISIFAMMIIAMIGSPKRSILKLVKYPWMPALNVVILDDGCTVAM